MATRIQLRRGTAAQWTSANPVLFAGEPAVETDTGKVKVGDGTTAWSALPYILDVEDLVDSVELRVASVAAVRDVSVRPPTAHVGHVPGEKPTVTYYRPATAQEIVTAAVNTVYLVDATNLKVTFVAPPSGQVYVTLTAAYRNVTTGILEWRLRNAAGTTVPGSAVRVGPNSTVTAREATTTAKITEEAAGVPLVPGKTYTFTWAHSSGGDNSYTIYGSSYTAAIMRVDPVPHRLTERQVTVTERPVNTFVPLWLSHDRTTLLGRQSGTGKLSWSTDDGVTWTAHAQVFAGTALAYIRELDNGELVAFCGQGDNGNVWISSGWATNKVTATFTKTLDFVGSPPEVSYGAAMASWSADAYGPIIVVAEYGPKNGTADMARYCYLSEDYGLTWRIIFDLAEKRPGNGSLDAHLHGVCYDPWWDAIWLTQGDNSQRGTWVSYDRGDTWLEIPVNGKQFTTIVAMPECILLGSDIGPDGIYRIPRTAKDAPRIEYAHPVGDGTFGMIAGGWFRARGLPDAPVLIAASGANNNPGRVWATYDGYTFREVWTDTIGYQDRGATIAVGPTVAGTYHVFVVRDDAEGVKRSHVVLTPA